jgi:hypothetical protein
MEAPAMISLGFYQSCAVPATGQSARLKQDTDQSTWSA